MKSDAPSGTPDPTAARARIDKAAILASEVFHDFTANPAERQLALQKLVILELLNDSRDFPQFLKNLGAAYQLIRYTAEVTRPALEAAIAEREAKR